jgi:hypothetical protein
VLPSKNGDLALDLVEGFIIGEKLQQFIATRGGIAQTRVDCDQFLRSFGEGDVGGFIGHGRPPG